MKSKRFTLIERLVVIAVIAAIAAGYPAIAALLPELLVWLQDYNWPVTHHLAPFLASIGEPMIPHIDAVLATDDGVWQYWMIVCLMQENDSLFRHYRDTLIRIASAPTDFEIRHAPPKRRPLRPHGQRYRRPL